MAGHPALEQRLALQAMFAGRRGGLTDVIRLHGAVGDQRVGALPQRVADQKFELPGLVAAGRETGAVVALDEEAGTAQQPGQVGHRLERCRQMGEADAREAGEMHGVPSCLGHGASASLAPERQCEKGLAAGGAISRRP